MPSAEPWDTESARAAAAKSVEARRRKAEMTPEERARDAVKKASASLMRELLNAAKGNGDFQGLDPKTRVSAILRALEYGLGKPTTAPRETLTEEPAALNAETLFGETAE